MKTIIRKLPASGAAALAGLAMALFYAGESNAHERWILTPEQIAQWNSLPKPAFYSELSIGNFTMVFMFLLFILGWIRLGFTGARELFPELQARLASYGEHVPRILRVCLSWMLISRLWGWSRGWGSRPSPRQPCLRPISNCVP